MNINANTAERDMSRSGYTDDIDDVLSYGQWRGQVASAIRGKLGQYMLKELLCALDEMPDKKLYAGNFKTESGEFCTLGVLGHKKDIKMADLGNADYGCNQREVGRRFNIAYQLASEIMFMNDEGCRLYATPEQRWEDMRKWIADNIND